MKITDAFITDMPRPMPLDMFDPMPEVIGLTEWIETDLLVLIQTHNQTRTP